MLVHIPGNENESKDLNINEPVRAADMAVEVACRGTYCEVYSDEYDGASMKFENRSLLYAVCPTRGVVVI